MSSTVASNQAQIIINIAFGIAATGISIITIWQGHRAWKLWHAHHCHIKVSQGPLIAPFAVIDVAYPLRRP